ncbi:MAG: AsmA family protein [Alphaproteobacteria bacterium]
MKALFRFIKKLILTILAVLFLAIAGIVVYIHFFFDMNQFKGRISQIVEEQTGRKFVINGNASLGISLIPTLELEDVEFANASWSQNKNMAQLERLDVQVSILPLLHKEIEIYRVILIKPEIFLEINHDGVANWDFATQQARLSLQNQYAQVDAIQAVDAQIVNEADKFEIQSVFAKNVLIENGLVKFINHKEKSEMIVKINEVSLSSESALSDIKINFDVVFNGEDIVGKANVGSIKTLLESFEPYPIMLNAKAFNVTANVEGSIINPMNDNIHYIFNVQVDNPRGNFGAPLTSLTGSVDGNLQKVKVAIQKLDVEGNIMNGNITADISGKVPYANIRLVSDLINLETLLPQEKKATLVLPSLISSAHAAELVPNMPIPYELLKLANANLDIEIKKLIINKDVSTRDVVLEAKLNNGVLDVYVLKTHFGDGILTADAKVSAINKTIALNLYSKNLLLQKIYQPLNDTAGDSFSIVEGGKAEVKMYLTSYGATSQTVVNNLNGQVIVIMDKSVVNMGELKLFSGNFVGEVLGALKINTKKKTKAKLACAVLRTDIENGKLNFPHGIAVDTDQFKISADGSVNLPNEKIAFTVQPFSSLTDVANISRAVSSFIKVGGTISNPTVGLNEAQAAKAVVGMALGAPVYAASVAMDTNSAPCYTALQNTAFSKYFPAPTGVAATGQDVYKGAEKTVKTTIKGASKVLKSTVKDVKSTIKGTSSTGTKDAEKGVQEIEKNVNELINMFNKK